MKTRCRWIYAYAFLLPICVAATPLSAQNGEQPVATRIIRGEVSTGANRYLGEPQWEFPQPWGTLGFLSVGGFNPGKEEALQLTPKTPLKTVLASKADPVLLKDFKTAVKTNVRLRNNYTIRNGAGERNRLVKDVTEVPGYKQSKSLPNDDITLADWKKAQGVAVFHCNNDGTASVSMTFNNLIENGPYTVWATYGDKQNATFSPVPLGGTPNFIVPELGGSATFKRTLGDCPLTPSDDDPLVLLLVEVALHSDNMVYGAVPDLPDAGYPFGVTTHTHIAFPVLIEESL